MTMFQTPILRSDDAITKAMDTLQRMPSGRRRMINARLLEMQSATAEMVYSLEFDYYEIAWRGEDGVIAEGDTMFPSLTILGGKGRTLVEWGGVIDGQRDREVVLPLLDLGRSVDCGYWPTDNPGETHAELLAREAASQ
jgi:hypothetical protein